jgi:hypothetical protein
LIGLTKSTFSLFGKDAHQPLEDYVSKMRFPIKGQNQELGSAPRQVSYVACQSAFSLSRLEKATISSKPTTPQSHFWGDRIAGHNDRRHTQYKTHLTSKWRQQETSYILQNEAKRTYPVKHVCILNWNDLWHIYKTQNIAK